MPEAKRQWKVIRIDDQVMDLYGRFNHIGTEFSGHPKPILRKMEEEIEDY
jgi:hypothetical protein